MAVVKWCNYWYMLHIWYSISKSSEVPVHARKLVWAFTVRIHNVCGWRTMPNLWHLAPLFSCTRIFKERLYAYVLYTKMSCAGSNHKCKRNVESTLYFPWLANGCGQMMRLLPVHTRSLVRAITVRIHNVCRWRTRRNIWHLAPLYSCTRIFKERLYAYVLNTKMSCAGSNTQYMQSQCHSELHGPVKSRTQMYVVCRTMSEVAAFCSLEPCISKRV